MTQLCAPIKLTKREVALFRRDSQKIPLQVLARRRGCTVIDLCAAVRRGGYALEVQPTEIQFILEAIDTRPAEAIRTRLEMTKSQFQQILMRFELRASKGSACLSPDEVIAKTRWLFEERLCWEIDDELPRRVQNDHFVSNSLSNLIGYAVEQKERDERFRGFPAVDYLTCIAYPGVFQPFQFRHAKGGTAFYGRNGRLHVLEAVRWILEKKQGMSFKVLNQSAQSKYFLRNADLQYYGIPPHTFRRFFGTQNELIQAVLRYVGAEHRPPRATSRALRAALGSASDKCAVPNCRPPRGSGTHIHHIIPRSARATRIDIHSALNLVALCPNHHGAARDYPWWSRLSLSMEKRRDELVRFLVRQGGHVSA